MTGWPVWNTRFSWTRTFAVRAANSGPRWSMVGRAKRPEHPLGNVGGPRGLQEMPSAARPLTRPLRRAQLPATSLRSAWAAWAFCSA